MAELERLKKHLNYLFLNISPSGTSPQWKRASKSTDFAVRMNGKSETYDYIADEGPTEDLTGYAPELSQTQTAYIGDPVYDYVFSLYSNQATGSDAVTDALLVYQQKSGNANAAAKFAATVTIDTYDIVAGTIKYKLQQRGAAERGAATVASDGSVSFTGA